MGRSSLSWHLFRSTILIVVLTVLIGGLPAVIITYTQLEQQVWLRVESAQQATSALYNDELAQLGAMARLAAQRPTLCALAQQGESAALDSYLEDLRSSIGSDGLVAMQADGQMIAASGVAPPDVHEFMLTQRLPVLDYKLLRDPGTLAMIAVYALDPPAGCDPESSRIVVIRLLDSTFMSKLSQRTGVAQSLIVGEHRIATSMPAAPDWPLNPNAVNEVIRSETTACCTHGNTPDEVYYMGLSPLTDASGEVIGISEVALPGGAIHAAMLRTMLLLGVVGTAALGIGAWMAVSLAHRIGRPLANLSTAAQRMGSGDMEMTIATDSTIGEIDALARQLDYARQQIRQSEQAARRERSRIERLLKATHDGVITLDEVGRVTSASSAAARILACAANDLLDKQTLDVFKPAPGETMTAAQLLSPLPGMPPLHHLAILNAAGAQLTLEVAITWLDADAPKSAPRERVIVFRDVSEEAALNRLRSHFLTNVSHEFRTPLAAVLASVEMLKDEAPDLSTEEIGQLVADIQIGTRHLQTLVDNLLESASMEAGTFRVSFMTMRLETVIESAAETMSPLLRRKGQTLQVEMPGRLPTFHADPDRLAQVLINLTANASRFSPPGEPIAVTVQQAENHVLISVQDRGPGLPAERFSDLFQRFETGVGSHQGQYGIGLGLFIVRAIVEAHGGQVGAENRAEGGARVWFTLPIKPLTVDHHKMGDALA
jgi:signal transduction histidine kinase